MTQKTLDNKILKTKYEPKEKPYLGRGTGESELYEAFSKEGFLVTTVSGLPDLMLIKNNIIKWIELKRNKKSIIRKAQIESMKLLSSIGQKCYIYFCEEKKIIPFQSNYTAKYDSVSCNVFLRHNIPTGEIPLDIIFILNKLNEKGIEMDKWSGPPGTRGISLYHLSVNPQLEKRGG